MFILNCGHYKIYISLNINFISVKRNTKSVGYFCVVIIGLGLTSVLIYIILYELFSSNSPSNIQKKALDRCIKDPRVGHLLGEPVKPYMIGGRRGRRNMR